MPCLSSIKTHSIKRLTLSDSLSFYLSSQDKDLKLQKLTPTNIPNSPSFLHLHLPLNKMGAFFFFFFLFPLSFLAALQRSNCETVVVDGLKQWRDPTAQIGDTIIFNHRNHYNVYIFRNKDAFSSCNFTQATQLSNPNSVIYTWHPSRLGNFYFSFYNGTSNPCQEGQKLAVEVISLPVGPPEIPPPATPGNEVTSSPAYPWPFQPREKAGPGPISAIGAGVISPGPEMSPMFPDSEGSVPFINSNPAVPLPTGEVDSATIRPFSTNLNHASKGGKPVRLIGGLISLCASFMVFL